MSTQLIVETTPESDRDILKLSSALYDKSFIKRVYYSAYIPVNNDKKSSFSCYKTTTFKRA